MCLNEMSELLHPSTRQLLTLQESVRALLRLLAEETRPCQACGAELFFLRHANGIRAPYTADAVNHFINCSAPNQFRRKRASK